MPGLSTRPACPILIRNARAAREMTLIGAAEKRPGSQRGRGARPSRRDADVEWTSPASDRYLNVTPPETRQK
jgi:hypothetical protein